MRDKESRSGREDREKPKGKTKGKNLGLPPHGQFQGTDGSNLLSARAVTWLGAMEKKSQKAEVSVEITNTGSSDTEQGPCKDRGTHVSLSASC